MHRRALSIAGRCLRRGLNAVPDPLSPWIPGCKVQHVGECFSASSLRPGRELARTLPGFVTLGPSSSYQNVTFLQLSKGHGPTRPCCIVNSMVYSTGQGETSCQSKEIGRNVKLTMAGAHGAARSVPGTITVSGAKGSTSSECGNRGQRMATVTKLPDPEFIMRCRECKVNAFYIILNSKDPYDVKGFECAECGDWFQVDQKVTLEVKP